MILDELYDYLGRFIVYPNNHARVLHTLWIAHTHLIDAFDYTPRLCILSAEKRSGKSTLVKLTKVLAQKGEAFVNPSPASIYSIIEERRQEEPPAIPTLCIDEQDRLWSRKETGELIAILDQGFEKDSDGVPRVRQDRDGKRFVERFNTFCPVLLAGIETSSLPDTISDRAVIIRMKRRRLDSPDEAIRRYRTRDKKQAIELRHKIEQWAKEHLEAARSLVPEIPSDLDDRYADICEPLFIVSDVTNVTNVTNVTSVTGVTEWPKVARNAILWFSGQRVDEEPSEGISFLRDIKEAFTNVDRLSKSDLEEKTLLASNMFNRLRKKFDIIKDHAIRIKGSNKIIKGWYDQDWSDAFNRYLVTADTAVTMVTTVTTVTNKEEHELPKADYVDTSHPIFEALKTRFNKKEEEPITYEDLQQYLLEAGQISKEKYKERTDRVT